MHYVRSDVFGAEELLIVDEMISTSVAGELVDSLARSSCKLEHSKWLNSFT